jgi:hypothetical protein
MFGIHDKHLKGTTILFASYETEGDTSGEALIFLREVKTCKLFIVRGIHTNLDSLKPKKGLRGLFRGQWSPNQIDPNVAMRIEPFRSNLRFIRIMNSLLKQQAIFAKFQKHCEDQKENTSTELQFQDPFYILIRYDHLHQSYNQINQPIISS